MNLKKVVLELDFSEVQEILAIDEEEDPERALVFIKENVAKQVSKFLKTY